MIYSLLLLCAVLPHLTLTASVNVAIINGTEATPNSRRYMVSVQKSNSHSCGGFLVSPQFVMTAAHCYEQGVSLTVLVGAHDLNLSPDRIAVKFYHIHPEYDSTKLMNDIMILQLNETTKKRKKVQLIPIPEKDTDIKAGTKCSVAGWGKQSTSGSRSNVLMEAEVTTFAKNKCKKKWGDYSTSRMVCAMGPGGFCQGDSGGPLVCGGTAVGIVSFNEKNKCDKPDRPNVYTKISKFLPWIKAILGGVGQELDK